MFYKGIIYGVLLSVLGVVCAQAKTPETQTSVSRPETTPTVVSRPTTQAVVSRPQTTTTVSRPATQVPVLKPTTNPAVSRPTTEVSISRPQTVVAVNHPSSTETGPADAYAGSSSGSTSTKKSFKTGANSVPSSSSSTTMSNFQMPQAKDFKAANLTKGDEGLGNPNDAEKNAAAASFQLPKGEEISAENLKNLAEKAQSLNKDAIQQKIENKMAK